MRFSFIGILISSILLSACGFEQDELFAPQTLASYLLIESEEGRQLVRYADSSLQVHWEDQLGLNRSDLGGVAIYESELWLGDAGLPGLHRLAPQEGRIESSFPVDSLIPSELAVGREVILVCDAENSQLGFWHKKRETLVRVPLATPATQPFYLSGQFYVVRQDTVSVYHETTFALLAKVAFADTVSNLEYEQRRTMTVYTAENDSLRRVELDVYSHTVFSTSRVLPIVKELKSPYRQANYGKERVVSILLRNNGQVEGFRDVEDIAYDFFEQTYFLLEADSIWVATRARGKIEGELLEQGSVVAEAHYQGTLADSK